MTPTQKIEALRSIRGHIDDITVLIMESCVNDLNQVTNGLSQLAKLEEWWQSTVQIEFIKMHRHESESEESI